MQKPKLTEMVEVFKTNVRDRRLAIMLVDHIQKAFPGYKANFDLEDCDNILRVKSTTTKIQPSLLSSMLQEFGCLAEVLPDECQPAGCQAMATCSEA